MGLARTWASSADSYERLLDGRNQSQKFLQPGDKRLILQQRDASVRHHRRLAAQLVMAWAGDATGSARLGGGYAQGFAAPSDSLVPAICSETLHESSTAYLFDQCLFYRPEARDLVDARDAFDQRPGRQTNYCKKDKGACRNKDATAIACEPGSSPTFTATTFRSTERCNVPCRSIQ